MKNTVGEEYWFFDVRKEYILEVHTVGVSGFPDSWNKTRRSSTESSRGPGKRTRNDETVLS